MSFVENAMKIHTIHVFYPKIYIAFHGAMRQGTK